MRAPMGLVNSGNTCYLNSALQALLSIDEFRKIVRKHSDGLSRSLSELSDAYEGNVRVANPIRVRHEASQVSDFFRQPGQQDSHECLIALIDALHEATKRPKKHRKPTNPSEAQWQEYLRIFGESDIGNLVTGQMRYQMICSECRKTRDSYEAFVDVGLPVVCSSVLGCLETFMSHELLEDPIVCDTCRASTKTFKSASFGRFPNILILTLKNDGRTQVSPEEILQVGNVSYVLQSVINHIGTSTHGGHYYATIRFGSYWFHVDDDTVLPLSGSFRRAPRVLVYQRVSSIV